MSKEIKTVYLKSKVSNQVIPVFLPDCVIGSISEHKEESGKIFGSGIILRINRLAFSQPEFDRNLKCATEQDSRYADIYAVFPLDEKEKRILQSDPFEYLRYEAITLGASYLDSKNGMDLYKVSPISDSVFIQKNFINENRPLSINFIRFNIETPNSSFRYYFDVETILKGEYRMKYTVVAIEETPFQFAERFRKIIEQNKNILDYPEIISGFVENNERIANFIESKD
ncbi:Uncharacterised protein [Kingella potus]|uniref:Uncharacterized protein n=1 Tax=Kingella potus TaxID=265175 RepID=A0A377QZ33_9NEIS|nr:hypothetical protein [Kingella potus]STR00252.1 Uncharacterised protein [Kingella potus]